MKVTRELVIEQLCYAETLRSLKGSMQAAGGNPDCINFKMPLGEFLHLISPNGIRIIWDSNATANVERRVTEEVVDLINSYLEPK